MDNLVVTEYQNQRVLTTQQIADVYGTESKVISNNFNNNKLRYTEGKHYIYLSGEELKIFLQSSNLGVQNSSKIRVIYLWTEKGAFLHAKSLNTDVAWEVYDRLVDSYFNKPRVPVNPVSPMQDLSPQLQLLIGMELKQKEQSAKLTALEDRAERQDEAIQTVKDALTGDDMTQGFSKWVIESIKKIAESAHFEEKPYRYQCAWGESYRRLTVKAGCNLDTLLKNAKKRATENGSTKAQVKNISKLNVIESNKRLKELYITCIREMMVAYCIEVA